HRQRQGRQAEVRQLPLGQGQEHQVHHGQPVLPAVRDPARPGVPGRHLPGGDLEVVHAGGHQGPEGRAVPRAGRRRHHREPRAEADPDPDPDAGRDGARHRRPVRRGRLRRRRLRHRAVRRRRRQRVHRPEPGRRPRGRRPPGRRPERRARALAGQARGTVTTLLARGPFLARAVPYLPLGLFAALGATLAYLMRLPCRNGGWNDQVSTYTNFCYTDIYPLYFARQLAFQSPYFADVPFDKHVEYPVVLGEVMQVVAWIARWLERDVVGQAVRFYDITVVLMGLCLVVGVVLMAAVAGPARRWDALWYALAPAVVLAAYINWDLVAGALSMGMLLAWARKRQELAGVLLGLAIATKFYPLMFIGALFLLTWRTGRRQPFLVTMGWTAGT